MARPAPADPCPRLAPARAAVAAAADGDRPDEALCSPDLAALVAQVLDAADRGERRKAVWLLLVALTGDLPSVHALEDAVATVDSTGVEALVLTAAAAATGRRSLAAGGTLVDVSTTARSDNHAGVPRVVRELVRAWGEPDGLEYVVWDGDALRTLHAEERSRLGLAPDTVRPPGSWLVPWGVTFVVTEVLRPEAHASAVEAMSVAGVADVRAIAYDLAALLEPHPDATRGPFLHHLSALAAGSRVTGISRAVAADLSDYFSVFARNGRSVPVVDAHVLPEPADAVADDPRARAELEAQLRGDPAWPLVLFVSSIHRRKNHARLLVACERLWDQGLDFRLLIIEGTGSRIVAVSDAMDRLVERGRPVTCLTRVSEPALRAAYRIAHVTAYPSLAEGYGLPIVESLAAGTPVVSSGTGSMGEVGAQGGVLFVDARDEDAIADGLRRVLTDTELHERLVAEAAARPSSEWSDYADAVGAFLGVGVTKGAR